MSEKLPYKTGRKTKLTPDIVEKAKEYVLGGYRDVGDVVTSHVGLAQYLGVSKSTVYLWMDGEDDLSLAFSDYALAAFEKQENLLMNGGLSGAYNANITKLLLSKHGYSEKVETANTSTDIADALQSIADKLPD